MWDKAHTLCSLNFVDQWPPFICHNHTLSWQAYSPTPSLLGHSPAPAPSGPLLVTITAKSHPQRLPFILEVPTFARLKVERPSVWRSRESPFRGSLPCFIRSMPPKCCSVNQIHWLSGVPPLRFWMCRSAEWSWSWYLVKKGKTTHRATLDF